MGEGEDSGGEYDRKMGVARRRWANINRCYVCTLLHLGGSLRPPGAGRFSLLKERQISACFHNPGLALQGELTHFGFD